MNILQKIGFGIGYAAVFIIKFMVALVTVVFAIEVLNKVEDNLFDKD